MTLLKIEELVAENEIRCDASADLVDQLYRTNDSKFRSRHLAVAFKVRKCKILSGQRYFRYEMVDENGEVYEMKCVSKLDDYMRRENVYPDYLLEQIKKLKP